MPIQLVTGLPGNAKTLYSIQTLIARAKKENRAVYYSGLKEFISDDPRLEGTQWLEFDPLRWHETVPSGALCFIDEAQKVFRARSLGTVPAKHVTELEEHRHKGLDFVMLTQHPSLIDPAIRRLAQHHVHMMRISGFEASTVHSWADGVKDNPDKSGTRVSSEKTRWAFPKELYGIYKSADEHTIKRSIPGRVKLLAVLALVFLVLAWYVVTFVASKTHAKSVDQVKVEMPGGQLVPQNTNMNTNTMVPAGGARPVDPLEDAKQYMFNQTPRVAGLPQTAPKYDPLTVPVRVPVPAMCIQKGTVTRDSADVDCKCFTQQGTPMSVNFNMCIEFARNGFFQDFDPERDKQAVARSEASVAVMSSTPDSAVPERLSRGSQVVAFTEVPERPVTPIRVTGVR